MTSSGAGGHEELYLVVARARDVHDRRRDARRARGHARLPPRAGGAARGDGAGGRHAGDGLGGDAARPTRSRRGSTTSRRRPTSRAATTPPRPRPCAAALPEHEGNPVDPLLRWPASWRATGARRTRWPSCAAPTTPTPPRSRPGRATTRTCGRCGPWTATRPWTPDLREPPDAERGAGPQTRRHHALPPSPPLSRWRLGAALRRRAGAGPDRRRRAP